MTLRKGNAYAEKEGACRKTLRHPSQKIPSAFGPTSSHLLPIDTPLTFLGPDYMSRAGPVSRAALVCRDDFQLGIT